MAKSKEDAVTFEGEPIIGNRVKVLGASGIRTDTAGHRGQWVRVTVEGPVGPVLFDPQADGYVREYEVKASQARSLVEIIDAPPEEPEIPGQTKLDEAGGIRDADGNVVTGPEDPEG